MAIRQSIECWLFHDDGSGRSVLLLHVPTPQTPVAFWQPVTGGIAGAKVSEDDQEGPGRRTPKRWAGSSCLEVS